MTLNSKDMERDALINFQSHSLAKLNHSLALTEKLLLPGKIRDRRDLLEFVSQYPSVAISSLSAHAPIELELLVRFKKLWRYDGITGNRLIAWSSEAINLFKDKLHWKKLSSATHLPWEESLLEEFSSQWDWLKLSKNPAIPWNDSLILKFRERWWWDGLRANPAVHFSERILEYDYNRNKNITDDKYLDLHKMSVSFRINAVMGLPNVPLKTINFNRFLPLSKELISRNLIIFNRRWLCFNSKILRNHQLEELEGHWNWDHLSANESLPWTLELLGKYETKWNRRRLFGNKSLPWSEELLDYLKYDEKQDGKLYGMSQSARLYNAEDLIDKYKENLDWSELSSNIHLNWSETLIERFSDYWNWHNLSWNEFIPWSNALIEKYLERWYWFVEQEDSWMSSYGIQYNNAVHWDKELLRTCKDYINPSALDGKNVEWDLEIVKYFADNCSYMSWDSKKVYDKIFGPYMDEKFLFELMTTLEVQIDNKTS